MKTVLGLLVIILTSCVGAAFSNTSGGALTEDLPARYKTLLGKLNPADEQSITRALDFYHRNFTPQPSYQSDNDQGYRDFKVFYEDAIRHLKHRIESAPEANQDLIGKLDRYGLSLNKAQGRPVIERKSGFLSAQFGRYLSGPMQRRLAADDAQTKIN